MSNATRAWLDCDHCGDAAIISESGVFADGDGGKCACCGFPGHVSVDDAGCEEENTAYWWSSDDASAKCDNPECEDCIEISAHGIPEGENGPDWPDGTPDWVKRGEPKP